MKEDYFSCRIKWGVRYEKRCPRGKIFIIERLNLFHFTQHEILNVYTQMTHFCQSWTLQITLGRLFMVIFSLLVNRRSSNKYVCSRYTCMPAWHFIFIYFLLMFVNLWPISTLCVADVVCGRYRTFVADMVVADVICGRYRRFPIERNQIITDV